MSDRNALALLTKLCRTHLRKNQGVKGPKEIFLHSIILFGDRSRRIDGEQTGSRAIRKVIGKHRIKQMENSEHQWTELVTKAREWMEFGRFSALSQRETHFPLSRPFLSLPSFPTQLPFPLVLGVANTEKTLYPFTPANLVSGCTLCSIITDGKPLIALENRKVTSWYITGS